MGQLFKIKSYCHIKDNRVVLDGRVLCEHENLPFSDFIKTVYRSQEAKYPKFFKMDNLSKLAFLAADILLNHGNDSERGENIAIVFSNKASSLDTDRKHQESIQDKDNYFPSPAVFVYTLPNICIGEISIRHKLYSENSFFIFDAFNAEHLSVYSNTLLSQKKADEVLCGWVEFDNENNYHAFIYLVSKEGNVENKKQEINELFKI
ncbi:3-oxoacyl-ACP synthase [Hyunsoonleella sp. SJ7]|uniref:3-oxoacyl-ACP synthase n=1 Tax=Hyunsoonleella aquatilis TaxID=2762758 RepID=A0A923HD18_9FLAO|nr:3-oxoacyl-ACP synthase [Hyunsoonleella aquatilis]MBC3757200.1 3-oxoacyl-ACP synthase [Hyunsoonleella aquatilis]